LDLLNYALINQNTDRPGTSAANELLFRYDSDGSWSEGKHNDVLGDLSCLPVHYLSGIEPRLIFASQHSYTIDVTHDSRFGIYGIAFLALLVPAVVISWRSYTLSGPAGPKRSPPMELSNMSSSSGDDNNVPKILSSLWRSGSQHRRFRPIRGWTSDTINQLKNVPKSVRDNPGSVPLVYAAITITQRQIR